MKDWKKVENHDVRRRLQSVAVLLSARLSSDDPTLSFPSQRNTYFSWDLIHHELQ